MMTTVETTRPSLLLRIRDMRDEVAYGMFVYLFTPLIYRFARANGLQDADASLVTQDVLITVARNIQRFDYDRQNGTFRGWLKVVTRSRLTDYLRSQRRHPEATGDSEMLRIIESQTDESQPDIWEREYRRSLFEWVVDRIQSDFEETTWQAFWRTAIDLCPVVDFARSLQTFGP